MLAAMLAAPAAHAGTITFSDLQASGPGRHYRPASEVRLRVAAQAGGAAVASGTQGQSPQVARAGSAPSGQQQTQQPAGTIGVVGSGGLTTTGAPDPTLSQSGGQVETVDLGDVTGTVCDCGEVPISIPRAAAGFPWWTLAGIPLVCLSGVCFGDDDTPPGVPPGPTPTPPSNPIPEPATLLLFGSGLLAAGAGARRRRQQQPAADAAAAEEV